LNLQQANAAEIRFGGVILLRSFSPVIAAMPIGTVVVPIWPVIRPIIPPVWTIVMPIVWAVIMATIIIIGLLDSSFFGRRRQQT
jgi:hypothetical protein